MSGTPKYAFEKNEFMDVSFDKETHTCIEITSLQAFPSVHHCDQPMLVFTF